jgi:hypothetical protein
MSTRRAAIETLPSPLPSAQACNAYCRFAETYASGVFVPVTAAAHSSARRVTASARMLTHPQRTPHVNRRMRPTARAYEAGTRAYGRPCEELRAPSRLFFIDGAGAQEQRAAGHLRTAGALQGVPPSCCGRRAAVWSGGACSSRPSGFREAARRTSSLQTWRWRVRRSPCPSCPTTPPPYVPRPSAVDHLDENMLNPTSDLLSHCHRRVGDARGALADR